MKLSGATLRLWGWNKHFETAAAAYEGDGNNVARVTTDFGVAFALATEQGICRGEMTGKLRLSIERGEAVRPAVGDWVVIGLSDSSTNSADIMIHHTLPRQTTIVRKTPGKTTGEQVLATNVDTILIVTSLGPDLNIRRLERYLAVVRESGATPVVVLSKADLFPNASEQRDDIAQRLPGTTVIAINCMDEAAIATLDHYLVQYQTLALIGSSGVGKSTLINRWLGRALQSTQGVRDDGKGRHTTTYRQLFVLQNGALVIDTPGMRELGLWENEQGVAEVFSDISDLALQCRFGDCQHTREPGCAVIEAVRLGQLAEQRLISFRLLAAELSEKTTRETLIKRKKKSSR